MTGKEVPAEDIQKEYTRLKNPVARNAVINNEVCGVLLELFPNICSQHLFPNIVDGGWLAGW